MTLPPTEQINTAEKIKMKKIRDLDFAVRNLKI